MKKCSYCGRENDEALSSCGECGTVLESPLPSLKPSTTKPPVAVVIAGVLMILVGAFSLFGMLMLLVKPELREAMARSGVSIAGYAMSFLGIFITLACGICVFFRRNWARWVFISWSTFSIVYSTASSGLSLKMLPSAVFVLIIALLLTLGCGAYFDRDKHATIYDASA